MINGFMCPAMVRLVLLWGVFCVAERLGERYRVLLNLPKRQILVVKIGSL